MKDTSVERNKKTTQMRASKDYLFTKWESATITGVWQRLKGRERSGDALQSRKKGSRYALIRSCWHGKAGRGLTRSGPPNVIG